MARIKLGSNLIGRPTKQATIQHWKTQYKVNVKMMIEYLSDSLSLDNDKETRDYCKKTAIAYQSGIRHAQRKLEKLGEI